MGTRFWKVEADGDEIYVEAGDFAEAQAVLREHMGEIPNSLLTWTQVDGIPDGEEPLRRQP